MWKPRLRSRAPPEHAIERRLCTGRTRSRTAYTLLPPARGAPQAPQAARSAAAGGGQQVRKIKRHFRFRSFATNVEIRYKSRLTRAEPATKTTEGRADSAPPGAPQAPQAVRSAATGGGQQVREIKRHFRFRGFATNIEIRYKST